MAKMFYTLDEAKTALNKNEEEIKQLAREGKLREFRDGPRLMFKADQIDALKGDAGGSRAGDQVDLGPSDSGLIGLADSKGASGTSLTLSDSDGGRSPGAGMTLKDDTALAADLGLSGSLGGVPSPRGPGSGSGTGLSGMTSSAGGGGTRGGIDVFQPGEVEKVDSSAQTAINPAVSDQLNMEGIGSGSGLLDLTRESDDTSLGAELLDEIAPTSGGKKRPAQVAGTGDSIVGSGIGSETLEESRPVGRSFGAPVMVEAPDATAPAFGAAALAAAFVCLFGAFVVTTGVLGTQPDIIKSLVEKGIWVTFGITLGAAILFFVAGLFIGKAAR